MAGTVRKVTIYDIAQDAETSPATVSLVLNGHWQVHRIRPETAKRVQQSAERLHYRVNPRARALRLSRSGLAGMIVPHYRNRLFTEAVEAFEALARARDLCPLVASTQRDSATEAEAVQSLLRQEVECLMLVGLSEAAPVIRACKAAGVRSVSLDLPAPDTPSVVTDNRLGARLLTERILSRMGQGATPQDIQFIGGVPGEYATEERLAGFLATAGRGGAPGVLDHLCGYQPAEVRTCLDTLLREQGRLPRGLFVNSSPAFEGVAQFLLTLDVGAYRHTAFGSFDWDPFGARLPFLAGMIRHDARGLVEAAFQILDDYEANIGTMVKIAPEFVSTAAFPAL